jgi:hypothetical protein
MAVLGVAVGAWVHFRLPESLSEQNRQPIHLGTIAANMTRALSTPSVAGYVLGSALVFSALFGFIISSQQLITQTFDAGDIFTMVFAICAGSMAFAEFSGDGGHVWRRLLLTRRPGTQRLLSANADGFQSSSARAGPTLEDSELAYIADDFVNVHSRIAVVLAVEPPDALVIVDTGGAHIPGVGGSRAGDALHFFEPFTSPIAALGGATVATVAPVTDAATWAEARALPAAMNSPGVCAAAPAAPCVRDFSQTAVPWRVTFAGGVLPTGLPQYALVQAAALQSAGALLRNNSFHDGFDKCANMNGGNGALVGNRFERVNAAPCVNVGGYFFWLEGALGLAGVRVEDNTFVGLGRDAAEVIFVHDAANVSVKGNVYE